MSNKLHCITIDTLTGFQSNDYMHQKKMPNFNQWYDYGTDIYQFICVLSDMGFELIEILGYEGSGKSSSLRGLPQGSNIWFNVDHKNPTWSGGTAVYGTKLKPISPWHQQPKTYQDVIQFLSKNLGKFDEKRYAFLMGHINTFKGPNETIRERLKILGNIAHSQNLEGKFEQVYYAGVNLGGDPEYYFTTKNSGSNTARSLQGMFDVDRIPNDLGIILQKNLEWS